MNTSSKIGVLVAAFIAIGLQAAAAVQPPVEAFGNLPMMEAPQISPDGKHFAVIQSLQGRPALVIYPTISGTKEKPVVISQADWIIAGAQWLKNDRVAVYIKVSRRIGDYPQNPLFTWYRSVSIDIAGGNNIVLLKDAPEFRNNTSTAYIVDRDIDDPNDIFMSLLEFNDLTTPASRALTEAVRAKFSLFQLQLFQVNAHTGEFSKVLSGSNDTREWFMDGHGHMVARVDYMEDPLRERIFAFDDGSWRKLAEYDATAGNGAHVQGVSEDGTALVRLVENGSGLQTLSRMDIKSGATTAIFSNPKYDAGEAAHDPWTGRVIGATYIDDKREVQYFDPKLEALQRGLEVAFPGVAVRALSWNTTLDKLIVEVDSPQRPIEYYFLDRTTHAASKIGSAYPDLQSFDLGATQPYPYKARDGLEIPAYLTLPPGKTAKNLPLVMLPHGGPDARDEIRFDWLAQFFANRGYAVLQPNYRGSSGYGETFTKAGAHQWGLKMQDDLTDGVRKLVADGIADPKRVCIVGASYGGYAALAGAALTPDVYACAVSFAGVSDLQKMLGFERARGGKDSQSDSFWTSRIGSTYEDTEQLRATSPAQHANQIKCPLLLMHGEGDTTVPIDQSEVMADAMKRAGKQVEFIRFAGEDHYFSLADTRIRFLKETEAFLQKNIGN